jgi:hypothetical protein
MSVPGQFSDKVFFTPLGEIRDEKARANKLLKISPQFFIYCSQCGFQKEIKLTTGEQDPELYSCDSSLSPESDNNAPIEGFRSFERFNAFCPS